MPELEALGETEQVLCYIALHCQDFPDELKDEILFKMYRGLAGQSEPPPENWEGETGYKDDGHYYLSDGEIPSDDEWSHMEGKTQGGNSRHSVKNH